MPTNAAGYMSETWDVDAYGALVDMLLEIIPDLVWPRSTDTYQRMRNDFQLQAILQVYSLAIRRARWSIDPRGCRDEVAQLVADDLGLPILDTDDEPTGARRRRFKWADHLRVSLLDQVYGHMFFEQTYMQVGRQWRLADVQERMPQTVENILLNPDGTLAALVQKGKTGINSPVIKTSNNALVYYVREREGSNYYGRSLLRSAYPLWLLKDEVMRVNATAIRRFGMGIPTAQALPGTNPQPNEFADAQRAVASFRASEKAGIAMPAKFKLALEGMTGTVPDALGFLQYLDRGMTRYTLTSLLDMATAERGSRALGETVMDVMIYAQQSVADDHATVGTDQICVPLVTANWGDDEPVPQIVAGDVGADLELTAQDIYWLTAYAALTNDPELEGFIRDRYKIPAIDPEYIRQPAAAMAPPSGGPASDG